MLKENLNSFKNFFKDSVEFAKKIFNEFFSRFSGRKITVKTEVKGAEKVEEVKRSVESIPKTKTVEVKVEKRDDPSNSGPTGENPDNTAVEAPQVTKWSKLKGVFSSLWSGVSKLGGGLKKLTGELMANGGGLLIIYEGVKSLIKIGQHYYNTWIDGMKEAAAMSEQNASSIREAAQANEELRQKGDEYLRQLEQIANQDGLSKANKTDAKKALGERTKEYGKSLGISIIWGHFFGIRPPGNHDSMYETCKNKYESCYASDSAEKARSVFFFEKNPENQSGQKQQHRHTPQQSDQFSQ